MKICSLCNIEKEDINFTLHDYVCKDGTQTRRSRCNGCRSADTRNWYVNHKEQAKASKQIYIEKNYEVIAERRMRYRDNHRKEEASRSTRHYRKHKKQKTNLISWIKDKYTGVPCLDCNGVFHWVAMDFDHRPEEMKSFGIATKGTLMATPKNISMVMKEISKCDIVCSNCHRVRTWVERQHK